MLLSLLLLPLLLPLAARGAPATYAVTCAASLDQRTHLGEGVACTPAAAGAAWLARGSVDAAAYAADGWARVTVEAAAAADADGDLVAA